jgi:predicted transcriptional regulator
MTDFEQPSDLELQVLGVLWNRGPSTVHDVLGNLPDGKERAYTTVLSVLQTMERKRLVKHEQQGRRYVYEPAIRRMQVLGPLMRNLVRNVFGGSATAAVQHLIRGAEVSDDELEEVEKLVQEAREEPSDESAREGDED